MRFHRLSLTAAAALLLLAACSDNGVQLGEFPPITKTEGDEPFDLVAPTSDSPAPFTFESSDKAVGEINGKTVTIGHAGVATITARQGERGSYNPTWTSTTLTVKARVCEAPSVNEKGVCVAPATTAGYVSRGEVMWMPASFQLSWAKADAFCKNTTIKGQKPWRLPTKNELAELVASGELDGRGWKGGDAWTKSAGATADTYATVNLLSGAASDLAASDEAYVTCVR
ncbi:Lcl domain-containing protein [Massilia haematophila]|uniref:DUF1566 domain-containing protein n=1 Tax=Massilia haematophila TaxID=457923 RepID=A0ABV7PEF3_9BURK